MTLVIEDGTGKTNSDSYVTVAEYNAFLNARYVNRTSISEAQAEAYIFRATDYFENQMFVGYVADDDQAMQWPRHNVVIDGFGIDSDEIPKEVKKSIYEIAYSFEQGYGINDPVSRETQSEKIGEITITYKNSSASKVLLPAATQALRKIVKSSNTVVRV